MSISPADFKLLSEMLKTQSGLVVTPDKTYLLESRLTPVAKKHGLKDLGALCGAIRANARSPVAHDVVEAMTTNESFFFRDITPFEKFKEVVLPHLKAERANRQVRIWSAACSSGQEPYSLAIILKEAAAQWAGWRFEIIATDLSDEMVQRGREGVYSQFEVQRGLPVQLMLKYFKQEGDRWRIAPELKTMVSFKPFNLLSPMSTLGRFDVIFCRNVLIYFDQPTKKTVLEAMAKIIAPDGFLFLGGAETTIGVTDVFRPVPKERGLYAVDGAPILSRG